MRLGLIARADNSGLGVQTWEFYRHMNPDKTLVVDPSEHAVDLANKHAYLDRFPGATVFKGLTPTPDVIEAFLDDIDVVYTAETFYAGHDFLMRANNRGTKTVLHFNYEFLDHLILPNAPRPSLFAAPSLWHYFDKDMKEKISPLRFLPVPIALDRFKTPVADRPPGPPAKHFLHIVGKPAVYDRNGTLDLLQSLAYVRSKIDVTIKCQRPGYVAALINQEKVRLPSNIQLHLEDARVDNYWDLYYDKDGQPYDALLLPRRFGGLCLPVNEAIGAGMPVMMPDVEPNNTWLPHDWLVDSGWKGSFKARGPVQLWSVDKKEMATRIDMWASDPATFVMVRRQALRLRQDYSWENLKEQYDEMFAALLLDPVP